MVELLPLSILILWIFWRGLRGSNKLIKTKWWEFTIALIILDFFGFVANTFIVHNTNSMLHTKIMALTAIVMMVTAVLLAKVLKYRALSRESKRSFEEQWNK